MREKDFQEFHELRDLMLSLRETDRIARNKEKETVGRIRATAGNYIATKENYSGNFQKVSPCLISKGLAMKLTW